MAGRRRLDDGRVGVAVDEAGEVADQVQVAVAVEVGQPRAFAPDDGQLVGRMVAGGPRVAARHHPAGGGGVLAPRRRSAAGSVCSIALMPHQRGTNAVTNGPCTGSRLSAMPAPGEHHPAFEEYCECIYELDEDDVDVIQARIADRLHVSRPAVSEMIKRLELEGLVALRAEQDRASPRPAWSWPSGWCAVTAWPSGS